MKNTIDRIDIVFENCELIKVPYSDVRYISMFKITESIWDNNILFEQSFEFKTRKSAKGARIIIKDKPEYSRVWKYNDITHIDFMKEDVSISYIGVEWKDGSADFGPNLGQEVKEYHFGEIDIMINLNEEMK